MPIRVHVCAVVTMLASATVMMAAAPAVADPATGVGVPIQPSGIEVAARKAGDAIIPSCSFAGGRCGYVDRDGKIVIEPQFDSVERFRDGRAIVVADGLYGAIDQAGRFAVPARFKLMSEFRDGMAQVLIDQQLGVVDKDGNWVLPAEYGGIVRLLPDAFLVGEPPYREARGAGHERLAAFDDRFERYHPLGRGNWGIAARGGAWLVRPIYFQVMPLSDELNGLFWATTPPQPKPSGV
jgi:hypothetical protein